MTKTAPPALAHHAHHVAVHPVRQTRATSPAEFQRAAQQNTMFLPRKGTDSIKQGFATMESRFQPSEAGDLNVRMQFRLTGKGGGSWYVVIKNGKCKVNKGEDSNPDTILKASAADYLKISNGEMNKVWALVRGKLKVEGSMSKVPSFFACFRKR